jgi:hypothetical protein
MVRRLALNVLFVIALTGCGKARVGNLPSTSSTSSTSTSSAGSTSSTSSATSTNGSSGSSGHSSNSSGTSTSGSTNSSGSSTTTGSSGTSGSGGSTGTGDTYLPWEGGPSYYAQWSHGPSSDPNFFPISVWLQSPPNATRYQAIGVNTFIGLYDGPTQSDLDTLHTDNMPVLCDQNSVALSYGSNSPIVGWTQQDEPDNAQSLPDGGGYGPCVDPQVLIGLEAQWKSADATRPVFLNTGQGTAWDDYYGRGSACAGNVGMYVNYAQAADILSFDIYPMNSTDAAVAGKLEMVPKGIDRLRTDSNYQKAVWNWIETTSINADGNGPSTDNVRSEVWMSLIHGSRGIGYFAHVIGPPFDETGLLDDATMSAAVSALDQQIESLAPVLNTPPIGNAINVQISDPNVPVDTLAKRDPSSGRLYVFAAAMRNSPVTATFRLRQNEGANATVLGENRTIAVNGTTFSDDFTGYAVHLYQFGP